MIDQLTLQLLRSVDLGCEDERLHIFSLISNEFPEVSGGEYSLRYFQSYADISEGIRTMKSHSSLPQPKLNRFLLCHQTPSQDTRNASYIRLILDCNIKNRGFSEMLESIVLDLSSVDKTEKIQATLGKGWVNNSSRHAFLHSMGKISYL